MPDEPEPVTDIEGARVLLKLGDSVTTDHISPAGAIKKDSPAGKYLAEHGVEQRDFNSYGSRRGNHEVMIRGTFANIRLRNQLAPGTEGGFTRDFTSDGEVTTVFEASENYQRAGIPLVVLAGKEYGSGSSRDWAAKGTALLGVKAVIAESYERIHRSNLIGMGVLPLQFPGGKTADDMGLTGEETISISGITELNDGTTPRTVTVKIEKDGRDRRVRGDGPHRHPRRGALLPQRRDHAVRAPEPAPRLTGRQYWLPVGKPYWTEYHTAEVSTAAMNSAKSRPPATGRNQLGDGPAVHGEDLDHERAVHRAAEECVREHPRFVGLDAEGQQAVVGHRQADDHGDMPTVRWAGPTHDGAGEPSRPYIHSAPRAARGGVRRSRTTSHGLDLDHRVEAELHQAGRPPGVAGR